MTNQTARMEELGIGEYITQTPSKRYPIYTRGNAGEVWPEVAYPLTITLTRVAGEIASAKAAINAGVISEKDIKEGFENNFEIKKRFAVAVVKKIFII